MTAPPKAVVCLWNGTAVTRQTSSGETLEIRRPQAAPDLRTPTVVFTRGDRLGDHWLTAYNAIGSTPAT